MKEPGKREDQTEGIERLSSKKTQKQIGHGREVYARGRKNPRDRSEAKNREEGKGGETSTCCRCTKEHMSTLT